MGACTLTPGNYCARLMNSIIGLGVSMSLAPFVCWERDGIALGWNGEGGGEKEGWRERQKGERGEEGGERAGGGGGGEGQKKRGCMEREGKGREQREGSKEEDKGIESLKSTVRMPACFTKTNECYLECTAQKTTGI